MMSKGTLNRLSFLKFSIINVNSKHFEDGKRFSNRAHLAITYTFFILFSSFLPIIKHERNLDI